MKEEAKMWLRWCEMTQHQRNKIIKKDYEEYKKKQEVKKNVRNRSRKQNSKRNYKSRRH